VLRTLQPPTSLANGGEPRGSPTTPSSSGADAGGSAAQSLAVGTRTLGSPSPCLSVLSDWASLLSRRASSPVARQPRPDCSTSRLKFRSSHARHAPVEDRLDTLLAHPRAIRRASTSVQPRRAAREVQLLELQLVACRAIAALPAPRLLWRQLDRAVCHLTLMGECMGEGAG
jgi:hypothetical protein